MSDHKEEQQQQLQALAEANVRIMIFHDEMRHLQDASISLFEESGRHNFYKQVVSSLCEFTGAQSGVYGVYDKQGQIADVITTGMDADKKFVATCLSQKNEWMQLICRNKGLLHICNVVATPEYASLSSCHPGISCLMGAAVNVSEEVVGVIYLANKGDGSSFTENDKILFEMYMDEVSSVLEKVRLLEILKDNNEKLKHEKQEQRVLIEKLEQAQGQLIQSEKMASIGQLAAGVAHEINNPIGYISSNLTTMKTYIHDLIEMVELYQVIEESLDSEHAEILALITDTKKRLDIEYTKSDTKDLLAESHEGIDRVKKIVQDLKDFSRVDEAEWGFAELHGGIDSTLNIVNNEVKYKATVVKEYGDIPHVECIASQVNQVIMNLLVNAAHAIEGQGTITIRSGCRDAGVWIQVSDTGKGIPAEISNRIFDPFFTTKPVGKGTGLGLSLSYSIVKKHHGLIEVDSKVGKGTTFTVWLPVEQNHDEMKEAI